MARSTSLLVLAPAAQTGNRDDLLACAKPAQRTNVASSPKLSSPSKQPTLLPLPPSPSLCFFDLHPRSLTSNLPGCGHRMHHGSPATLPVRAAFVDRPKPSWLRHRKHIAGCNFFYSSSPLPSHPSIPSLHPPLAARTPLASSLLASASHPVLNC